MPQRDSPPHSRRRSRSPKREREDYGRGSPRRRSPDGRRGGDNYRGGGGGGRGGRATDGGWGGGATAGADGGFARKSEGFGGRKSKEGSYSARDRETERDGDRKRYDEDAGEVAAPKSPPKPNFAPSGLLAKESNMVQGVALKYHEPPEARKPVQNWRLYVFKGDEQVDLVHIYKQSCYLVGRDAVVTDIPIQHPSCSKQHAAIQFRLITKQNEFGDRTSAVKPFVIDLDSTNGTYVNGIEVPKSRYYELQASDVLKFGTSSREYVLLHEDAGK